ncbi:hypothetical protein BLOT_012358 [Blomia tropicalis]|nr:hypothetical protein BLOT_012358 [Blomia tropicalis]
MLLEFYDLVLDVGDGLNRAFLNKIKLPKMLRKRLFNPAALFDDDDHRIEQRPQNVPDSCRCNNSCNSTRIFELYEHIKRMNFCKSYKNDKIN